MISTNKNIINKLKKDYPIGTRITLVKMDDVQAPPIGTIGTVKGVDDTGSLLVSWDNGSSLNVIYNVDEVEKVEENKMMNYKEFVEKVVENIINYMPSNYEDEEVELYTSNKNNDTIRKGIFFKTGNCNPILYLEQFYELYEEGTSFEKVMKKIANAYIRVVAETPQKDLTKVFVWEKAKDNIFPYIVNKESNKESLKNYLYSTICDMAIMYRIELGKDFTIDSEESLATISITPAYLEKWNISLEELHEVAMSNNNRKKSPELIDMENMIMHLSFGGSIDNLYLNPMNANLRSHRMFVLRNSANYGSNILLNSFALNRVCDILDSDLIIIPSSVHETLVLEDCDYNERINDIINDVNENEVEAEEVLGSHAYFYSKEKGLYF